MAGALRYPLLLCVAVILVSGLPGCGEGSRDDTESRPPEPAPQAAAPVREEALPTADLPGSSAKASTSEGNASQRSSSVKIVHVFVALCDNKHQGIVRVNAELGNGQEPRTNLYWGAMYGVRTFFSRSPNWESLRVEGPDGRPYVLERVAMASGGTEQRVIVVADAYDGARMKEALKDFLDAASGGLKSEVLIEREGRRARVPAGGASDLVCFVGHNGLMDVTLDEFPVRRGAAGPAEAIVLACRSRDFFEGPLRRAGCRLLLGTTGLMAPEAYTLDAAIRSWAAGAPPETVRADAAKAYAEYQRIAESAAVRLFAAGRTGGG